MYRSESFQKIQMLVSQNQSLGNLLELLPTNFRVRVILEDRIPCRLTLNDEGGAVLLPEDESRPEWELVLYSEAIRILQKSTPDSLLQWVSTLSQFVVLGHLKIRAKLSLQEWWARGYPHIAFKLKDFLKKS